MKKFKKQEMSLEELMYPVMYAQKKKKEEEKLRFTNNSNPSTTNTLYQSMGNTYSVSNPKETPVYNNIPETQSRAKEADELWIRNNPNASAGEMFYPSMRKNYNLATPPIISKQHQIALQQNNASENFIREIEKNNGLPQDSINTFLKALATPVPQAQAKKQTTQNQITQTQSPNQINSGNANQQERFPFNKLTSSQQNNVPYSGKKKPTKSKNQALNLTNLSYGQKDMLRYDLGVELKSGRYNPDFVQSLPTIALEDGEIVLDMDKLTSHELKEIAVHADRKIRVSPDDDLNEAAIYNIEGDESFVDGISKTLFALLSPPVTQAGVESLKLNVLTPITPEEAKANRQGLSNGKISLSRNLSPEEIKKLEEDANIKPTISHHNESTELNYDEIRRENQFKQAQEAEQQRLEAEQEKQAEQNRIKQYQEFYYKQLDTYNEETKIKLEKKIKEQERRTSERMEQAEQWGKNMDFYHPKDESERIALVDQHHGVVAGIRRSFVGKMIGLDLPVIPENMSEEYGYGMQFGEGLGNSMKIVAVGVAATYGLPVNAGMVTVGAVNLVGSALLEGIAEIRDQQRREEPIDIDKAFNVVAQDGASNVVALGGLKAMKPVLDVLKKIPNNGAQVIMHESGRVLVETTARSGVNPDSNGGFWKILSDVILGNAVNSK